MEKVPFTRDGLENLKIEYNNLKKIERPEIIKPYQLQENTEIYLKMLNTMQQKKQSFIEGRISELEDVLSRAEIMIFQS